MYWLHLLIVKNIFSCELENTCNALIPAMSLSAKREIRELCRLYRYFYRLCLALEKQKSQTIHPFNIRLDKHTTFFVFLSFYIQDLLTLEFVACGCFPLLTQLLDVQIFYPQTINNLPYHNVLRHVSTDVSFLYVKLHPFCNCFMKLKLYNLCTIKEFELLCDILLLKYGKQ